VKRSGLNRIGTKVKTRELQLSTGSLYRWLRGSVQGQGFSSTSHNMSHGIVSHEKRQCSGKGTSQG